jgi:hypothetical protein
VDSIRATFFDRSQPFYLFLSRNDGSDFAQSLPVNESVDVAFLGESFNQLLAMLNRSAVRRLVTPT